MRNIIALIVLCFSIITMVPSVSALAETASTTSVGASGVLEAMKKARESLVALLDTSDKGTQTVLIKEVHDASAEADKQLDALLADPATPEDMKIKLTDAKSTWEEFKKTREEEIIPAIQAGEVDKAKGIATGVQKERFKKIVSLLQ